MAYKRYGWLSFVALLAVNTWAQDASKPATAKAGESSGYEIAAYYFPNYHPNEQNAKWHGPGWTEWELMKRAEPRFEGHRQPRVPLWGYTDESKPEVMEQKIAAAADHGLTAFIFDWYWYEGGPYLHGGLDNGFLNAKNNDRLKFSIMWANHDWLDIQPSQRSRPANILAKGAVSPKIFRDATDHMIKNYFPHPSYWRVNGGLYVSFYDLTALMAGFGGVEQTRAELDAFRERVRAAGLGELNINAVVWGQPVLPGEKVVPDILDLLDKLGFDSIASYVWVHHQPLNVFPKQSYTAMRDASVIDAEKFIAKYKQPYYPNVTMGWDSSPRTIQSDVFENVGYPYTPVLDGNTPEAFREALQKFKDLVDRTHGQPKILSVNAWNEWTEGSYLEPDTVYGMGYLEAIRDVFGVKQ